MGKILQNYKYTGGGVEPGKNKDTNPNKASKVLSLFDKNSFNIHQAGKNTVEKSVKEIAELDAKETNGTKKIRAWSGVLNKLENTPTTDKLLKNPLTNGEQYGKFTKKQVEKIAKTALEDKPAKERNNKIAEVIKNIENENHKHAYTSLRDQLLDKSLEPTSDARLKSLFTSTGPHGLYEPQNVKVSVDKQMISITYEYLVEVNGKKEKRSFTSSMALTDVNGKDGVTQTTTGRNLVIKTPGRGYTDSVNQEEANQAIPKQKGKRRKKIEFNAAHVLADQFLGSGYRESLNLVTTSGVYNKEVMGEAERNIKAFLKLEEGEVKKNNPSHYISFDITVSVDWNPLNDKETLDALKKTNKSMSEEHAKGVLSILAADTDPKLVNGTIYTVDTIYIRDANGQVIEERKPGIVVKRGADETMKKVLNPKP